jgi:hypothetical protein
MMFFSLSGLFMWSVPRMRKVRNFARNRRFGGAPVTQ